MKKFLNIISKKAFISSLLFILEMLVLSICMIILEKIFIAFWLTIYITNFITILIIVNSELTNAFKLSWTFLILILPGIGAILFYIFGKKKKLINYYETSNLCKKCDNVQIDYTELGKKLQIDGNYLKIMQWIYNLTNQPVYCNTKTTFLKNGEIYFQSLISDLKSAKKTIFLEFYIIKTGFMWNEIVNILIEKAANGVDVRLIYDDFGTLTTLPKNYDKFLNSLKIKTQIFNKIKLKLNSFMNNRDHRKIILIDNKISYTGGINIADEYINKIKRFGYWQDSAIKLEGSAVESFNLLFLNMWNFLLAKFISSKPLICSNKLNLDLGLVLPFGDNPVNKIRINSQIYLKIVTSAKKYVYIQTPYLIMDEKLTDAIIYSAQSNVKIVIITPHIFDKFYVHTITRNSYKKLIEAGVKIYEYTPGFIHSKMIISDDVVAVLGTANFDYRSLYMQFENGVFMYGTDCISQMKADFHEILKKSELITKQSCSQIKPFQKILNIVLKPFITFL